MNLERNIVQQSFSAHVCHLVSDVTRQSKPENYCVLNLPPALFPTKMGAALFLGKSLGDEAAVKYCPVQIVQTQTQPRPEALLAFQGEAR